MRRQLRVENRRSLRIDKDMYDEAHPFPAIPLETLRAADPMLDRFPLHRAIGDQYEQLLEGMRWLGLDCRHEVSQSRAAQLALVTVLQILQGYSDYQAAEASRIRIEWKYALHLPLNFRGFMPQTLCFFRQQIRLHPENCQAFQELLQRFARASLVDGTHEAQFEAAHVLKLICGWTRLERMSQSMNQALEALAALYTDWLRQEALPYWVLRYNRSAAMQHTQGVSSVEALAQDASYLLRRARQDLNCCNLAELQALQQEFDNQFEGALNEPPIWRATCAVCAVQC